MDNLKYLGNYPERAPMTHPPYLTYRHVNIVIRAFEKFLTPMEISRIKDGHRRSAYTDEALITNYMYGNIPKHEIIKDDHYYAGLEQVRKLFEPIEKTKPVSFPDLRYYPWKLGVSAEAPYTNNPSVKNSLILKHQAGIINDTRVTFRNLYNEMLIDNRMKIHIAKEGGTKDLQGRDLKYWNQAHARSHLVKSDEEDKIRMVYGVPKLLLMAECMFIWPLINDLLCRDGPMLWGHETLKGGWYKTYNWFASSKTKLNTFLAFDWRGFDRRVSFTVVDDLHDVMRSYILFDQGYVGTIFYPDSTTKLERTENLWNWMRDALKHTPDVLPNGDTYQRQHSGLASGFLQTQLLGSMYNALMILTTLSDLGIDITKVMIKVQGDDSIVGFSEYIHPSTFNSFTKMFATKAERRFGSELNTKKSRISNTLNGLPLLGYKNDNGYPTRDREELLAQLLYPERKSSEERLMARVIGIAYANCGYDSTVYSICEEIYKYLEDQGCKPDRAGLPGMFQFFDLIQDEEEAFPMVFPSFYETMRDITSISVRTDSQKKRFWDYTFFTEYNN